MKSLIRKINDELVFPIYFIEDYFQDYFTTYNIIYSHDDLYAYVKNISFYILFQLIIESYSALIWYPQITNYSTRSYFVKLSEDWQKTISTTFIAFPKYIRLDTVSCKDIGHNGIFYSSLELISNFRTSHRIFSVLSTKRLIYQDHYLFVRDIDYDISNDRGNQFKCFFYKFKLTCISSSIFVDKEKMRNMIIAYFKSIDGIPYNDCIIDLFMNNDNEFTMIEINHFTENCNSGLYDWVEDYDILHAEKNITVDIRCAKFY